jgi:hypothetical protein
VADHVAADLPGDGAAVAEVVDIHSALADEPAALQAGNEFVYEVHGSFSGWC